MLKFKGLVWLAAAWALGACEGGAPQGEKVGAEGAPLNGPECPPVLCGTNNGVGNVPFYELDASMAESNSAGLRITGFRSPAFGDMKPKVDGDRLIGKTAAHGDVEGDALKGAWFTLVGDKLGLKGRLVIEKVDSIAYKVAPQEADYVPLYYFVYHPDDREGAPTELCRNTLADPEYGTIAGSAIVFSGDRYDPVTLQVRETGAGDSWFNIGCPGTGAMKMHLFRHTLAGGTPELRTEVPQRQALLKMFGADYCGTGKNFTVDGQPIAFNFNQGWLPEAWAIDVESPDYESPEAIWREDGAQCLLKPRRSGATPGLELAIAAECNAVGRTLPTCKPNEIKEWKKVGYAVTMNPATSL